MLRRRNESTYPVALCQVVRESGTSLLCFWVCLIRKRPFGQGIWHVIALFLGMPHPKTTFWAYSSPGGSVWMVMAPTFGYA